MSSLVKDSARHGTTGDDIDFALLVDGLEAEREQNITIDVAYRFFTTPKRSLIVADTPGHEQYTCNMATGASTAQLAVILIDARKGVLVQTRRHSLICALLGIKHVIVAINKIDLVGFDQETFERIASEYRAFGQGARVYVCRFDPLSPLGSAITSRNCRLIHRGITARRFWSISNLSTSRVSWTPSRSVFQSNGSTGPISISAAMPALSFPVA